MSTDPVSPFIADDVGARVSVRYRIDGGVTDVVGDLVDVDPTAVTVLRRHGDAVVVPSTAIVAARLVGPSFASVRELEAVSARSWPAPDTEWLGSWWLRAASGFTMRANSVRPLGDPGCRLDDAIRRCAEWYRARDLPIAIRTVAGTRLDTELGRRGWVPTFVTSLQTATLAAVRASGATDSTSTVHTAAVARSDAVQLLSAPNLSWWSLFHGGDTPSLARAVVAGAPNTVFATIYDAEMPAAIGRATVEGPWVGLSAIEVAVDQRRRGYARAVIAALIDWARDRGALRVYLEVLPTNEAAIALYESLRFTEHHRYQYRRPTK